MRDAIQLEMQQYSREANVSMCAAILEALPRPLSHSAMSCRFVPACCFGNFTRVLEVETTRK